MQLMFFGVLFSGDDKVMLVLRMDAGQSFPANGIKQLAGLYYQHFLVSLK